jgi:hypothetical protein
MDLIENRAAWIKNGTQIASISIPLQMRNKPLYFMLVFKIKNDEVEVILD